MRSRTASQSTAASQMEIRKTKQIVDKQQRAMTAMDPQELETMQINPTKRKKGMLLDVVRALVRLQRLSEPRMTSPTGLVGSGVRIAFEAVQ